jgi:exopolysaccharide biosynthesis polyprenyl glycosylphosphotransferase
VYIRLPWLLSRRRLIVAVFLDCLLFSVGYVLWFVVRFGKLPGFSLPATWLLEVWVISSYVLGRYYDTEASGNHSLLKQCLSTAAVFTLSVASYLGYLWLTASPQQAVHSRSFLLPLMASLAFASGSCQFWLNQWLVKRLSGVHRWLLLGTAAEVSQLNDCLRWSRQSCVLEQLPLNASPATADALTAKSALAGIVVTSPEDVGPEWLATLLQWQNQGINLSSTVGWCDQVLQRFPPHLLSTAVFIRGDFKITKGTFQLRLKRIGDVVVSLTLLLLSSPLLLLAALVIRLEDGGPVFYSQLRSGLEGNPYRVWKLRTMGVNAEQDGAQWVKPGDSRITPIGRVLRLTRLDELPQLWSVFTGEMSLIGPRPERPELEVTLEQQIPHYRLRHGIRPGLSGWAQVNYPYGASLEDAANKLSYDLYYLRNFSFWLDLLILVKTMRLVFNARGAVPAQASR